MKMWLCAGHHPAKPGARAGDMVEHYEALVWAGGLESALVADGVDCEVLPPSTLNQKVNHINRYGEPRDIAIDIHFNSAEPPGRGAEVLYYPGSERGRDLAIVLAEALSDDFPPNRGAKEGYYRLNPNFGIDWFLQRTICTAVIIEPEFVQRASGIRTNRANSIRRMANVLSAISTLEQSR